MRTLRSIKSLGHGYLRDAGKSLQRSRAVLLLLLTLVMFQFACGSHNSSVSNSNNLIPTVASLSPSKANQGGPAFVLTVSGSNFASGAMVQWNGGNRITTFVSSTQLTASIPATDIASSGAALISVINPPSTGSAPAVFPISPPPVITSLSPSTVTVGAAFTLNVFGTNFVSGATVQWNGSGRPTTFGSGNQLTASIPASDVATSGSVQITVVNPSSGGTSNSAILTVSPAPTITSISPASAIAGAAPFTLTVNGTNFVSGSTAVQWNGNRRLTTFVSNAQVTAIILASDVAASGTAQVTVISSPNNVVSNALAFAINTGPNPAPALASVVPSSFPATVTGLALTVNGTNFVSGSIGQWNGANRGTIVLSNTQLLLAPLPADNAAAGAGLVTVLNPPPGGGTTSPFSVAINTLAASAVGVTDRVSVPGDFTEANDSSFFPAVNADGRYIAFQSDATNLVPSDTNAATDIFVRDTCRGAAPGCSPSITRISVATDGSQANGNNTHPVMSGDGRFIAFVSSATNLASGSNNGVGDVFVRDTCVGALSCTPSTTRVSLATDGTHGNAASVAPAIDATGRFIAFESSATNLIPGDTNGFDDIFVRDTCLGATSCTPSTTRVSVASDGSQATQQSSTPSISADGRFVAFESIATNLVSGGTSSQGDIFLRDTCVGATGCTPSTSRVSRDSTGAPGNGQSFLPRISGNGRFVVFTSFASNLVASDSNGVHDVFVRDTCFGASGPCTASTALASVDSSGKQGDTPSGGPATNGASITPDGRFIAFGSRATNLVPGDTNATFDIFVRDTCAGATGCAPATIRVSIALDGTEGTDRSDAPVITSDGRFVVFQSLASNLLPGAVDSNSNIFVARTGKP